MEHINTGTLSRLVKSLQRAGLRHAMNHQHWDAAVGWILENEGPRHIKLADATDEEVLAWLTGRYEFFVSATDELAYEDIGEGIVMRWGRAQAPSWKWIIVDEEEEHMRRS